MLLIISIVLTIVIAIFLILMFIDNEIPRISLLVPFQSDGAHRELNWQWLHQYWSAALPEAEIIVQSNDEVPFCKTAAVNDAYARSHGDIIVILDADCYMSPEIITECAQAIREARAHRRTLWYLPYRRFYRLTEEATEALLASDPTNPRTFTDAPDGSEYEHTHQPSSGHWWGALIQIMPSEAFEAAGGMDENFKGWGGEDISFMHAVDTLYGKHRTYNGAVYHLWHPTIPGAWKGTRQWEGQDRMEMNDDLATRYEQAYGDPACMYRLTEAEGAGRLL